MAESYRQDRYGRSSINRSLSVRISCVISIVQNSVSIQNTTWLGKRMLEQCTYDNTKHLWFSKTLYHFQFAFYLHVSVIQIPLPSKSFTDFLHLNAFFLFRILYISEILLHFMLLYFKVIYLFLAVLYFFAIESLFMQLSFARLYLIMSLDPFNMVIEVSWTSIQHSKHKSQLWISVLQLELSKRLIPHRINLVDPASYQRD